jgi:hypothetical protein
MRLRMAERVQLLLPFDALIPVRDGIREARMLYDRHYSARRYRDGRRPKKVMGPGEYLLLASPTWDVLVAFRRSCRPTAGQTGVYLAIFRNESARRASDILREALHLASERWPQETRVFTFVNERAIKSQIPGYCFRRAGFRHVGNTQSGLLIFARRLP